MNSTLDIELPNELLVYKANIEATVKPYVEIKAKLENDLRLWQSKFGGFPYLPKEFPYPKDSKGQAMFLLAQINFAEVPRLESFPEQGILQFYITGWDDIYGMSFEDLAKQDNFRVLYFPYVFEDEAKLIVDFSFLPKPDSLPLQGSCSLTFNLDYAPLSVNDYQFEAKILGQNAPESKNDVYKILDEYGKLFPSAGHKLGGYPYFTQYDPE